MTKAKGGYPGWPGGHETWWNGKEWVSTNPNWYQPNYANNWNAVVNWGNNTVIPPTTPVNQTTPGGYTTLPAPLKLEKDKTGKSSTVGSTVGSPTIAPGSLQQALSQQYATNPTGYIPPVAVGGKTWQESTVPWQTQNYFQWYQDNDGSWHVKEGLGGAIAPVDVAPGGSKEPWSSSYSPEYYQHQEVNKNDWYSQGGGGSMGGKGWYPGRTSSTPTPLEQRRGYDMFSNWITTGVPPKLGWNGEKSIPPWMTKVYNAVGNYQRKQNADKTGVTTPSMGGSGMVSWKP
jgi:hypothetical protein